MKTNMMMTAAFALGAMACCAGAASVRVDFGGDAGPVKPVNGVGQPPMVRALLDAPMFRYLKDAGVPYSRLHDVGGWFGGGIYVDIPNLFPDFDADENDPKNYRFAFTDRLLENLADNGVEPFFRLGVSIENFVGYGDGRFPAMRCKPPKDYAKWARICEHVIRHYTEGWADGCRMKITHWEIWNEPDNEPDEKSNPNWNGSFGEFMRFYGVSATYLKSKFPRLKIGGYGSCGFYAGVGAAQSFGANSSPRLEYFVSCFTNFCSAAKANGWPLDFFTFHSYSNPDMALRQVRYADEKLTEFGFPRERCARVFNEWLPYADRASVGTARQAAGVAAELVGLQNSPCDIACIYDARCDGGAYSPLFDAATQKPRKPYYAFTAFNELRKLGRAAQVAADARPGFHVAAAADATDGAVMLANDSDMAVPLDLDFGGAVPVVCRLTGECAADEPTVVPKTLPPHAFCIILCKRVQDPRSFSSCQLPCADQVQMRKASWLAKAEAAKPVLISRTVKPVRRVKAVADKAAFQGWRVEPSGADVLNRPMRRGESFVLDFGEHLVGYLSLRLAEADRRADSPVRLKLTYAETPAELALPFEPFKGTLSRSWLPDETVFFDEVPAVRELDRRHAFRYVKVEVESACVFSFADISVRAVTSADEKNLLPWKAPDAQLAAIDAVALRTLRDCMQTTLEDGPKRDRRLWIGDLRLQALANYASYRNYGIVRRCLYHFAGTADERGLVSSDAYERPKLVRGDCHILDYTALFPAIVLEYLEASGDRATAEDLWPLCVRQMEIVLETVGKDGLFRDDGKWWCFIDWNESLDRQAAEQGVIAYGLDRFVRLAKALGREGEAVRFAETSARMKAAARRELWDAEKGVFVSGAKRQVSQMSQAWLVLAGIAEGEDAKRCLKAALEDATAERPRTPYATHYLVEALQVAGLDAEADALLRAYWGGMVAHGADTFWEAFDPKDDDLSPYGNILLNSACHAWSCGPAYLLRRRK